MTVRDNDTALPAHVPPNISISTLYGALSGSRTVTEGTRGYFCLTIDGPNPAGTSLSDRLGAFPSHHPGIFRVAVEITDSSGQVVPRWGKNSMQFHRDHWNRDAATRANCLPFDTDGAEGETYAARVIRGGRVYSQGRIIRLYETGHMTSASIAVVRPMSSPGVGPPVGQLPTVTISADGTSVGLSRRRFVDRMLKKQFLSAFGTRRLDRIRRLDVERWFDAYSRTAPGCANAALQPRTGSRYVFPSPKDPARPCRRL